MILKLERLLSIAIIALAIGLFFMHNAGVTYGEDGLHVKTGGNVGIGTTTPNSALEVAGPIATALVNKTTAYTVSASNSIITADASGGGFTLTLPTASGITGRIYTFKKIDSSSNIVRIDGNGLETIDGEGSEFEMDDRNEYLIVVSHGMNWLKIGGGAGSLGPPQPSAFIEAAGGILTYDGDYKIHTFNSSGTFYVTSVGIDDTVEYLVVGGGGSGGGAGGGGGGAGGYRTATGFTISTQDYPITVGAGGTGGISGYSYGNNGDNSVFSTITAVGGGGGGYYGDPAGSVGKLGGSGGGAGGAGQVGHNAPNTTTVGAGGDGISSSITGAAVVRGGGGGGASAWAPGAGGAGGGGAGGDSGTVPTSGSANTGGGGGYSNSGSGGSGVVIIRYKFQ